MIAGDSERPDEDATIYAFRRNLVVAASAGTGKTHRLTGLYAMLTLGLTSRGRGADDEAAEVSPPSRIVATTFSRAAAREIADRVTSSLEGVAAEGEGLGRHEEAIRGRLQALRDPPSREELRQRAQRALAELPSARIDTVHGLAARIVLEHALELGLPPGARVLDEGESAELDALVVDETLHAALAAGGALAETARHLLEVCGGLATTRIEVAALLARLDEEGTSPEDLHLGDHAGAAAATTQEAIAIASWVAAEGSERLRPSAKAAEAALRLPGPATLEHLEEPLAAWFGTRVTKTKPADEAFAEFRDRVGRGTNAERGRALARFLGAAASFGEHERGALALLADAQRRLRRERDARRALSFGDVLRFARDGLRDRPNVAARVRASVDALLVDEFQDTSPVQRDLVHLLRERPDEAQRRPTRQVPGAGSLEGAGLFLVGDRKQSIYGFRGADVGVFTRLCAELAGEAAVRALELPPGLAREPAIADFAALRQSYRAGPALCAMVNTVASADFGTGPATHDFEIRYGTAEQLTSSVARPGDRVILVRDDGQTPASSDPFVLTARGPLRAALTAAAAIERELLPQVAHRDVAVLARRRSTIPLVELALHRRGIPYVVAGRALFDALEVRDLAALLRLLLDPRERRALATVLRGPIVSLSDEGLLALSVPGRGLDEGLVFRGTSESDALLERDDRARLVAFRERFAGARPALLRAPPAEAVRQASRAFDLDLALAALPRAAARLGNLERIEALARGRGGSLAAFSRYLEAQIASEADGEEAVVFSAEDDAVRLTTIHASKGLDFRAVVLLDLEAAAAPRPSSLGLARHDGRLQLSMRHRGAGGVRLPSPVFAAADEELRARERAERVRLSYVALTRAREHLVLIAPPDPARRGSLHATLDALGADLAPRIAAFLEASTLLGDVPEGEGERRAPERPAIDEPPDRPEAAPIATVALATTPLGTFRGCARRFRLRHLLGFEEPLSSGQLELFELPDDPPEADPFETGSSPGADEGGEPAEARLLDDPRALGRAAHRVLERWPRERWGDDPGEGLLARLVEEGLSAGAAAQASPGVARFLASPFAADARGARVLAREHPFVVSIPGRAAAPRLEVRGAVDLLVADEHTAWVVDYKLARPSRDLEAWAFQLRTYALAARSMTGAARVFAGVVFLLGGSGEPQWIAGRSSDLALTTEDHEAHEAELGQLAARFAEARWSDRWDPIARPRCEALRCGFLTACHAKRTRA